MNFKEIQKVTFLFVTYKYTKMLLIHPAAQDL